jgi:hypothetical protein
MSTPLEKANGYISEIADISHDDLFDTEFHLLALHDERNRLQGENIALRAEIERWQKVAEHASAEREHNANVASEARAEVERLRTALETVYGYGPRDGVAHQLLEYINETVREALGKP